MSSSLTRMPRSTPEVRIGTAETPDRNVNGFQGTLESIPGHDYDTLRFIAAGDYLLSRDLAGPESGKTWSGGSTPGGRFCTSSGFAMAGSRASHLPGPRLPRRGRVEISMGKKRNW